MVLPQNFKYALRIFFLLFRTVKVANRYMKIILMIFLEKLLFGPNSQIGSENDASL